MNTAQRAALLIGGIVALVALLVAAVAPVSTDGYGCGSALIANDDDYSLSGVSVLTDEDLRSQQVALEELSASIGDDCADARRSRLMLVGIGVVAGGAVMAGGVAIFRDRE